MYTLIISLIMALLLCLFNYTSSNINALERKPTNMGADAKVNSEIYHCHQYDVDNFCEYQNHVYDGDMIQQFAYNRGNYNMTNNQYYTNRLKMNIKKHWYKKICGNNCSESFRKNIKLEIKCIPPNIYNDKIYKNILISVLPKNEFFRKIRSDFLKFLHVIDTKDRHFSYTEYDLFTKQIEIGTYNNSDGRKLIIIENPSSLINKKVILTFVGMEKRSVELLANFMLNAIYKTEEYIVTSCISLGYKLDHTPLEAVFIMIESFMNSLLNIDAAIIEDKTLVPKPGAWEFKNVDEFNFYISGVYDLNGKLNFGILYGNFRLNDLKVIKFRI